MMTSVHASGPGPTAELVEALAQALQARGWRLACAESCTGGLLAAACTERAGSSLWFDRGFVTYSNEAKTDMLGVSDQLIAAHGAVSDAVVQAMALGALQRSLAQVAVSISGVAGPSGGSAAKPVGTVWLAWAVQASPQVAPIVASQCSQLGGDRAAVRSQAVDVALRGLLERCSPGTRASP